MRRAIVATCATMLLSQTVNAGPDTTLRSVHSRLQVSIAKVSFGLLLLFAFDLAQNRSAREPRSAFSTKARAGSHLGWPTSTLPELATIILFEHALAVATCALLAEHPTLIDDFQRPREQGLVMCLASRICKQAATLLDTLRRYTGARSDGSGAIEADVGEPDRSRV